ncbi:MAG: hypothetical protein Q4C85_01450 [Actinomyces sp.]|uniref:hypothetical protein n=1 Tax=Actinomyces sp. TaxID=29317 RepID=UPI0026DB71DF|nr:hypothetical protein [Actinomyces sp.]MDO4242428.1 hypothetical protein [Actinomyces sp.]
MTSTNDPALEPADNPTNDPAENPADKPADPAASDTDPVDRVWSASSLEAEPPGAPSRRPRRGTVTWGLLLCLLAGLLAAISLGMRIDIVAVGIIVLAGAGIALLAMALLPGSRSRG